MGEYKICTFSIVEYSLNLEEDAVHMCACQCVHVHACVPWHTRRVTGQLVEVGSALYHVDPGDQP